MNEKWKTMSDHSLYEINIPGNTEKPVRMTFGMTHGNNEQLNKRGDRRLFTWNVVIYPIINSTRRDRRLFTWNVVIYLFLISSFPSFNEAVFSPKKKKKKKQQKLAIFPFLACFLLHKQVS